MSSGYVMPIVKNILVPVFFSHYTEIKKCYFQGSKLSTQSYFVETIINANDEVNRAYVQELPMEQQETKVREKLSGLF